MIVLPAHPVNNDPIPVVPDIINKFPGEFIGRFKELAEAIVFGSKFVPSKLDPLDCNEIILLVDILLVNTLTENGVLTLE